MDLQRTRIFLLVSLFVVGLVLFSTWQQEQVPVTPSSMDTTEDAPKQGDMPYIASAAPALANEALPTPVSRDLIQVETDVLKVKIDPVGGDIVFAELTAYPKDQNNPDVGFTLLDTTAQRNYVVQSGLIGKDELGPDSHQAGRAHYQVSQRQFNLGDQDALSVDLQWQNPQGIQVTKSYVFKKNQYLVDVFYRVHNATQAPWHASFYGQVRREHAKEKSNGLLGVQMYQGAALYTPDKPYKKISYSDMKKQPFRQQIEGGWAAMLEHYFLSSWIPNPSSLNNYYTRLDNQDVYNIGAVSSLEVPANSVQTVGAQIYMGPEKADVLKNISKGLNLTVDYGILWPISQMLFWLLKTIHHYIGNWGFSIIFVTLFIKLAFYKLSAASYRSMGKMRLLQPRIELLKTRYKDDKQQFSAALMDLYKKEKLNPLGGCLPIVIQIPVFIALYYVLLESVELRHAPFILWITDLSSKDPYYILPLFMGATMFLQQRMNPAPPDPIQAKVMMFMPVVFTVLFLSFPAGLVLYWTVNNLLSILQQWFITRGLGR